MFANPSALFLLIVIPLALAFLIWRGRHRRHLLERIGDADLVHELLVGHSALRQRWQSALWLVTVAAIIVALARPVWGVAEEVVTAEGVSIVVVLDVSRSMDAQDVMPSRLDRARLAAREIFERSEGSQFALILFAREAIIQFPLTTDSTSALNFLNAASTRSITRQGTAIGAGLELALDTIDERISSQSVIILLSDGENHDGDPLSIAELAAARGIQIHTIGYGTMQGAQIPEYDDRGELIGYISDGAGNVVQSRLEPELLQEIADITGGTYQTAGDSGVEIVNLLNAIDDIEAAALADSSRILPVERFGLFVLLAVCALTVEMFLPRSRGES